MALHKQFADTPQKILALELGGNNPLVVWGAKDIDAAATIAVQSAYLTAGQRCTAARRLIVEDGKEGELLDAIMKLIDRMIVDQPFADPQPFMGPVIDNAAADLVQEQWLNLMMKGGKPLRRLDRPIEERPYLTPALIDVTDVKDRPDEEIFGPVLQVIRVKDFDAAIDEANNTRFGLAASLVGGTPGDVRQVLGERPRRRDQLEQADQRRPVQCAVRRHRPVRQPPAERLLRGGLLRLSGDQRRGRPRPRRHRRRPARPEHAGRLSSSHRAAMGRR